MTKPFVFFSDRLSRVEIYKDFIKDFEFQNNISSFEIYVFGIVNQYQRIQKVVKQNFRLKKVSSTLRNNNSQVKLDIYYFFLTWDKLNKIFEIMKSHINNLIKEGKITTDFTTDYRQIRKRIEHLFREYDSSVRNEYEHPSLKYDQQGNVRLFGNTFFDGKDISVHVGSDVYGTIKKTHIEQLELLRIELIDLFIKHFTNKRTTKELIQLRKDYIKNIDKNIKFYVKNKDNQKLSNELLSNLIMTDLYFSSEGISLPKKVHDKIHNIFNL
jgi:hypothetical protein